MGLGGAPSLKPFNVKFFPFFPIILTITTFILITSAEDHDSKENGGIPDLEDDNGATTSSPPPPPLVSSTNSSGQVTKKSVTFKPSTTVIIGVLIATFSLTILILLYIKHCNSGNTFVANPNREGHLQRRNNSGIERDVVELLPIFRFGSLRGQKDGLECAVCLNGFEDPEVLRLLPKCKHAFHVECVDTWLDKHSTCPLCRYKVNINDVVQVESQIQNAEEEEDIENGRGNNVNNDINNDNNDDVLGPGNVGSSRRVSSVGEMGSGLLEIVLQREDSGASPRRRRRRSLDISNRKSGGEHRLEHRIIVSPSRGVHERWSDCQPSDLLYLTSDMIIKEQRNRNEVQNGDGGRKWRSVSAMTGIKRILNRGRGSGEEEQEQRRDGLISRWLASTSKSRSQRDVC